jgi:IMP dehydrogenase/GMP reductase
MKFDFDDILIQPEVTTDILSRAEINLFDDNGMLPLFTAPMDTVVNKSNSDIFNANYIYSILPRTLTDSSSLITTNSRQWKALSLIEFERYVNTFASLKEDTFILIDIANGHMNSLVTAIKKAKEKFKSSITIMAGNVAHPRTYKVLSEAGADYVRIGIGNGNGCLTTQQTGIGYPMASLIKECYQVSCALNRPAKIVADGGFKKYADIIKALALGADYVMLGSVFNKALESAGETYTANIKHEGWTEPGELVDQYSKMTKRDFESGTKFYKKFRGMSTKEVQKSLGNTKLKTSEGITKMQPVEYTLEGWVENFSHYLSSAMSYCNKKELEYFIGNVEYNLITQNAYNRFNK